MRRLVSEVYRGKKEVFTKSKRYPVKVEVKYKWKTKRFQVIFTENSGQEFKTEWLWNFYWVNDTNTIKIENKLKRVEDYLQQELQKGIERDMMELRRKRYREARINDFIDRNF